LPLSGGAPHLLVQGPFDETAASFSPGSTSIAFQSSETGRWEIYVQRLRDGRRVLVSTDGGERPLWLRDGLYYQSRGRLMRAQVSDSSGDLRVGPIATVTNLDATALLGIAPDGRALVDRGSGSPQDNAVVSLEWPREVRQLLGPPAATLPR
jgi:Tol biopolymer transport system component